MGIDINPMAVRKGNEWLAQGGISNVKLLEGKADELGQFQDKSFDVVFTDAVLMCIGSDKIKDVMKEMIRVARRALILVEWHTEDQRKDRHGLGVYWLGYWKRDYVALLKQFIREDNKIHVTKIPENLWPGEGWGKLGHVIKVVMRCFISGGVK
jgi:ubiquinone/menaquinone biosynthesis C-methylase UbiE